MATETDGFLASQAVADEPEHRRPEPDEQGSALSVSALVLTDRLSADPKAHAKPD